MLFAIVIGAVLMVVMFNTTQKVTDKTIAENAADAGAYSAGVWTARQLNFMAYTNRAMIANHVAVGHMVAYVSWVRYIESTVENISTITDSIPYVGAVVSALEAYAEIVRTAAEVSSELFVPVTDDTNRLLSLAQHSARIQLQAPIVNNVMEAVVHTYDPSLRVNQASDLNSGAASYYRAGVEIAIVNYTQALAGAVEILSTSEDSNEMSQMVTASYAGSEQWLNNRSWRRSYVVFKLRKEAHTTHTMNDSLTSWKAEDKLRFGRWTVKGWRWNTIGSGEADTEEFDSSYKGIHTYARKAGEPDRELFFDLVTLATKSDIDTVPLNRTRMGIDSKGTTISGYSKARVYFERPKTGFAGSNDEHSNLYNPFWRVKMVEAWP
jgi:hypothetical protein